MSEIKHIQCPSCGSGSTFKTSEGHYKCNYCQTTIVVKENSSGKINPGEILYKKQIEINQAPVGMPKFLKIILLAVFCIVLGSGILVYNLTSSSPANFIEPVENKWQQKYIENYECFVGSKGPAAWIITKQTTYKLDSVKLEIKIIDPSTKKVLAEKFYLPPMTWQESFNANKKINNEFMQINDWVYNSSEDNLLLAFDIYTFSMKEDAASLQNKFPELASGISKTEIIRYKNAFKITTNQGDEFVYYPKRNILRKQKEDDYSYRIDTATVEQLFLREKDKHHELWRVKQKIEINRDEMTVNGYELDEIANGVKNRGTIRSAQLISEKKLFKAQGLARYKNNFTVIYAENLSKKANVVLECFSDKGESLWKIIHPDLQKLIESPFQTLNCNFRTYNNLVVINLNGTNRKSICFDSEKGKHLWTFSPDTD